MEIVIALIGLGILVTLIAPTLLSREIILALIAIAILTVVMPNLLTREQTLALISFGILFSLVIPNLLKG
jgi:hypothetical protein